MIRANDETEFYDAANRIRALLQAPDIRRTREAHNEFIQVETYIPGREFAVEGIVTGGRLQMLAIFDKPDPLEGSILRRDPVYNAIERTVGCSGEFDPRDAKRSDRRWD